MKKSDSVITFWSNCCRSLFAILQPAPFCCQHIRNNQSRPFTLALWCCLVFGIIHIEWQLIMCHQDQLEVRPLRHVKSSQSESSITVIVVSNHPFLLIFPMSKKHFTILYHILLFMAINIHAFFFYVHSASLASSANGRLFTMRYPMPWTQDALACKA